MRAHDVTVEDGHLPAALAEQPDEGLAVVDLPDPDRPVNQMQTPAQP